MQYWDKSFWNMVCNSSIFFLACNLDALIRSSAVIDDFWFKKKRTTILLWNHRWNYEHTKYYMWWLRQKFLCFCIFLLVCKKKSSLYKNVNHNLNILLIICYFVYSSIYILLGHKWGFNIIFKPHFRLFLSLPKCFFL